MGTVRTRPSAKGEFQAHLVSVAAELYLTAIIFSSPSSPHGAGHREEVSQPLH